MVRQLQPDVPYVTFDDPAEELAFHTDPEGVIGRFPDGVIFDEVQRVPELMRYIKMAIDADPARTGRFVLTGSNQLMLHREISESLAGRVGLISLLPFEAKEIPPEHRDEQMLYGAYPALAVRGYTGATEWFGSYIATYLEKDIRLAFDIGKLSDFQVFIRLIAARTAQEFNALSISREIGVSSNTVDKWMSILHAGYLTFPLAPFHANIGKRLIKRPKIYFVDTGLVCYLTGIRDRLVLEGGPLAGPLFENMVVAELHKRNLHSGGDLEFFFYRDNRGAEIDLIAHDRKSGTVSCIEIKAGQTAKPAWAEQLGKTAAVVARAFPLLQKPLRQIIVYNGRTKRNWPKAGIDFVNVREFLEAPLPAP